MRGLPSLDGFDRDFMIRMARRAGDIHLRRYMKPDLQVIRKSDGSEVADADLEVRDTVIARIRSQFPHVGIISEESGVNRVEGSEWWVIADEVDGTMPFCQGVPTYAFTMALCYGTEVVQSVVQVAGVDTFYANLGGSAWMNGVCIRGDNTKTLAGKTIIGIETCNEVPIWGIGNEIQRRGGRAPQYYSLAYNAMLACRGASSGVIWTGSNLHDGVPLYLILERANLMVTDVDGQPMDFSGKPLNGMVAAATPELHAELLECVKAGLNK